MIELCLGPARLAFSTREGGVSAGPYGSLNLGFLTDDDSATVAENRGIFARAAGLEPGSVAMGHQVHGAEVREWTEPPGDGAPPEVDGHTTTVPGLGLAVLAADCYPVALAGEGRVAMLHCGWRGLAGGIIQRGVEAFEVAPAAVVGPGIGQCCYEVGPEVNGAFEGVPEALDGRMLDLRAVAEYKLRAAGVTQITQLDLCTSCREDQFFSHRRDNGVTGRQAGMIWLEDR